MKRFLLVPFLILAASAGLILAAGCDYITGKVISGPAGGDGFSWGKDASGRDIVIDRQTGQKVGEITPEEASSLLGLGSGPAITIIDVRTPSEYAAGHIPVSLIIDINSPSFEDEVRRLDPTGTYLVYCRTGRRSALAQEIMVNMGFTSVINMTGGFVAWLEAGLPAEK